MRVRRGCDGRSEGCGTCAMGVLNEQSEYDDDEIFCAIWEDYHDAADVCEEWEDKQP